MKTFLISVLFLWLALAQSQAQTTNFNNVRPVEFEIGTGLIQGLTYNGNRVAPSGQLLAELRLNHTPTPFDVGLQFTLTVFDRRNEAYLMTNVIRHRTLVTFVDYNFRRWKQVALFAGFGIGMASVRDTYDYDTVRFDDTAFLSSFVMNPRIGVELFNRIRLTAEFKAMDYEYSYFGLNFGVVIGGGRRR